MENEYTKCSQNIKHKISILIIIFYLNYFGIKITNILLHIIIINILNCLFIRSFRIYFMNGICFVYL